MFDFKVARRKRRKREKEEREDKKEEEKNPKEPRSHLLGLSAGGAIVLAIRRRRAFLLLLLLLYLRLLPGILHSLLHFLILGGELHLRKVWRRIAVFQSRILREVFRAVVSAEGQVTGDSFISESQIMGIYSYM